tara:strand:- start:3748 stop:5610 length:1863 start_codon:yes stop_codon:yes gene_type:complete
MESPRTWLPTPERLTEACQEAIISGPDGDFVASLEGLGCPPEELLVTPFSARVGAMAAAKGLSFFHHELRGRLPVPDALMPEVEVWESGGLPVWQEGVLIEPKYFSFFLDAPFVPYNPNYRRKWRAHELIHSLSGFFWRPDMTRFECYMGARLDELLPIVHWYGLDEMFRPRCEKHIGKRLYRDLCPDCEALARPFWEHDESFVDAQSETATLWARRAHDHFAEEWDAIIKEYETGQRVETPRGQLNASSDAVGYLMSHWPRLTAWSFGSWVELFLRDGVDYHSSVSGYMGAITDVSKQLFTGEWAASSTQAEAMRARRLLQDIGARTFLALEWLPEHARSTQRIEDAMMPLLESAASLSHELLEKPTSIEKLDELVSTIFTTFQSQFGNLEGVPEELKSNFVALGVSYRHHALSGLHDDVEAAGLSLIREGLLTAAPARHGTLAPLLEDDVLRAFVRSDVFLGEGRLLQRLVSWVEGLPAEQRACDAQSLERLQFEAWLRNEPIQDKEAKHFSVLVEDVQDISEGRGEFRMHHTFRCAAWSASLIEEILGEVIEGERAVLGVIHRGGEQALSLFGDTTEEVIAHIRSGVSAKDWLDERYLEDLEILLENAFVCWFPVPR